jgi:hypothetical protein
MDQLTIMRRANGDLFTSTETGRERVVLWPSLQSAIHYKARNPELLVFFPASAMSDVGRKSLVCLQNRKMGLFLLTDNGGAHLSNGRKIGWDEFEQWDSGSPAGSMTTVAGRGRQL